MRSLAAAAGRTATRGDGVVQASCSVTLGGSSFGPTPALTPTSFRVSPRLLAEKRRCGWLGKERKPATAPVWARGWVSIFECPKSYITAESLTWIEEFQVRKLFGFGDVMSLPARAVDAFCTLERESIAERMNADQ